MSRTDSTNNTIGSTELFPEISLDSIPDAVLIADPETGQIVASNAAAGDLFDCNPTDLIGHQQTELHPTENEAQYIEAFRHGIDGDRVNRLQNGDPIFIETFDGRRKPVEINAQRLTTSDGVFLFGVFREVSEQIERERRLKSITNRLNTLLDALPVPVAVIDTSGTVVRWNPAAEATYGYTSDEVIGEPYPLFIDDDEFDQLFKRVLNDEGLDGYETIHRTNDGSRIPVEVYSRPLYVDNEFSGVIGSAISISNKKRRKKQLDVLYRVLRHNLRNELNVMMGWARNLEQTDSEKQQAIKKIRAAHDRLVKLSENAAHIRANLTGTQQQVNSISLQQARLQLTQQINNRDSLELVSVNLPDSGSVSSRGVRAISQLLDTVCNSIGRGNAKVSIIPYEAYIKIDVTATVPILSSGAQLFVTTGKERSLEHSSNLEVAKELLIIESIGGDMTLTEGSEKNTLHIELPRTDN